MPKPLQAFICCLILLESAFAQNAISRDSSRQLRIEAALALFKESPTEASTLYNGREYTRYSPTTKGHAYFMVNDWQTATILYDGITYADVPALYDMVKDELVIRHFNGVASVQLVKEKVDRFSIAGHSFVRVDPDSTREVQLLPGFYDQLHNGKTVLLVKRTKQILEHIVAQQIETSFEQKNNFFILKEGKYHSVKNAAALLHALGDKRKEVQQYLRKHQLKFRRDPEATAVKAVAFYEASKN